jgi:glutamate-1-semialdehyde 2,1-aminomutase
VNATAGIGLPECGLARRSLGVLPGGSNGEFGLPPELTVVLERGDGCRLWTADGRELIDFSMGWGSALVGHARAEVVSAVRSAVGTGANFAYPGVGAVRLAERLVALSPACERVRFCASGTEATMYGLRLARAWSGRAGVLRFEGAYHGSHDVGVTSLFPSGETPFPEPEPSSAGIESDRVFVAPYNDLETTRSILEQNESRIGAVIVEPFQRCLSPAAGFLEGLREVTERLSIPLVFDEVVTGFRLGLEGAQGYYGVVPDLAAYGKALGGGLPIGAFGGRADIMDLVHEDRIGTKGYVWTASSLGGNPVSAAAANAALDIFETPGTYERLHELGRLFREELARVVHDSGRVACVLGDGPLGQVVFTDGPVADYRSHRRSDRALSRAMMLGLFERGVFLNPMGTKLYLSLAHDASVIDAFMDRLSDTLRSLG